MSICNYLIIDDENTTIPTFIGKYKYPSIFNNLLSDKEKKQIENVYSASQYIKKYKDKINLVFLDLEIKGGNGSSLINLFNIDTEIIIYSNKKFRNQDKIKFGDKIHFIDKEYFTEVDEEDTIVFTVNNKECETDELIYENNSTQQQMHYFFDTYILPKFDPKADFHINNKLTISCDFSDIVFTVHYQNLIV